MAAKGQRLALGALGLQGPGGADTVARHRLAQPRPAVTGWTGDGRGLEGVGVRFGTPRRPYCFGVTLTSAVGEAPVARGAHGAVPANHVGPTATLTAERLAGVALGADLVAAARQSAVIEEGREGDGRAEAERRGGGGTGGLGGRGQTGLVSLLL